jgi:hypothetical protein
MVEKAGKDQKERDEAAQRGDVPTRRNVGDEIGQQQGEIQIHVSTHQGCRGGGTQDQFQEPRQLRQTALDDLGGAQVTCIRRLSRQRIVRSADASLPNWYMARISQGAVLG